jgi:hypothetical protein
MELEFTKFVRKPFTVEATEVTTENIAEIAEKIGTLRTKDNGTPYIAVDRRLVPNLFRVYPGFWMTQMGDNIRCYSRRIFRQQFIESTPEIDSWIEYLEDKDKESGHVHSTSASEEEEERDALEEAI